MYLRLMHDAITVTVVSAEITADTARYGCRHQLLAVAAPADALPWKRDTCSFDLEISGTESLVSASRSLAATSCLLHVGL